MVVGAITAFVLSQNKQDIRQQASADPLKVDLILNPN